MNWRQVDQHHWARECKRYTVSTTASVARPGETDYLPWRVGMPPTGLSESPLRTLDDAIACCTNDLKQMQQSAAISTKG
jgi:hypothetical protein